VPYVDEMVQIMVELNKGFIDFPILLPKKMLFLLLMMVF
jgi:hypothetical protein